MRNNCRRYAYNKAIKGVHFMNKMIKRCPWAINDRLLIAYHDKEWGVPIHDDRKFFEMLILEGMQAGLSWITVLRKRENFHKAFDNFDPQKIAHYDQHKIKELLADTGIIRNRLKINAVVQNAKCFLLIQKEFGSFDEYIWTFGDGKPITSGWSYVKEIPARTEISDKISKDLKKRDFKFVGSTICYALMQATGLVNDHVKDCFRFCDLHAC